MAMSDGTPTEEQEVAAARAKKRLSLRRETVLQWVNQTVCAGEQRENPFFSLDLLTKGGYVLLLLRSPAIQICIGSRGPDAMHEITWGYIWGNRICKREITPQTLVTAMVPTGPVGKNLG